MVFGDLQEETTFLFSLGELGHTKGNQDQEEEDNGREREE